MEVTVQIHGALGGALPAARRFGVSLPESATVADLLGRLAERLGAPFASAATSSDPRLPREIRLFVGGDLVALRGQRLARQGSAAPVTVVLLSPVAGG